MNRRIPFFCLLLALIPVIGGLRSVSAGEDPAYAEPILEPMVFKLDDLGMIEAERRQYADNMAAAALSLFDKYTDSDGKIFQLNVPPAKYTLARKLIGLALHIDPRSRSAIIANGRLKAGVVPRRESSASLTQGAFASLLVGRAAELRKAGGDDNLRLAGCFLELSVALDPSSDDAIFALETFKLDGNKVSWNGIVDSE